MSNLREELAWASGLFEGEGTVYCTQNSAVRNGTTYKVGRQIVVRLVMTDADVMIRFAEAFDKLGFKLDVQKSGRLYGSEKKLRYTINAYGFEKVQALIAAMWPWLGHRRQQQANKALIDYKSFYSF